MKTLDQIVVGDIVHRYLGGTVHMPLAVSRVTEDRIYCGLPDAEGWTFDRHTGVEIDDYLEWGPQYGKTGSYIMAEEKQ